MRWRNLDVQPVTPAGWERWWEGFRVDPARLRSIRFDRLPIAVWKSDWCGSLTLVNDGVSSTSVCIFVGRPPRATSRRTAQEIGWDGSDSAPLDVLVATPAKTKQHKEP